MENNKELNDSSLEKVNGGADKNTDVNHNVTINGETVTVKGDQLIHLSFENQHLSELYTEWILIFEFIVLIWISYK